jgi:hypothetical protein
VDGGDREGTAGCSEPSLPSALLGLTRVRTRVSWRRRRRVDAAAAVHAGSSREAAAWWVSGEGREAGTGLERRIHDRGFGLHYWDAAGV